MRVIKKLLWVIGPMVTLALLLTGCHTMQGMGEDIQAGGHAISKAAT